MSDAPKKGSRWMPYAVTAAALLAGAAQLGVRHFTRIQLPSQMEHNPAVYVPELLDEATQRALLELLASKGEIPSNNADLSFYKTLNEHIGEAQPIAADGTCEHPYLVPNMNHTLCVLPGRIDIARAFALTGGFNGLKEDLSTLFSRLQSFGIYLFDLDTPEHVSIRALFDSATFLNAAKQVCPAHKQHLDPFQFNFIVQVPGQTVATHVDGVYFWGATRFALPQWLLAVMNFSGLFKHLFVDQVQVVGYLSDWDPEPVRAAPHKFGEFVFWDEAGGKRGGKRMPPLPRSGNAIDGSKSVHTTTVYRPDVRPPFLDKNVRSRLVRNDSAPDRWDLVSGDARLAGYDLADLRISIVYRARCFADAAEASKFRGHLEDADAAMGLEDVLGKLVEHGRKLTMRAPPSLRAEDRLELALWLLDTYVAYPFPDPDTAWVPVNYCALFRGPNMLCP